MGSEPLGDALRSAQGSEESPRERPEDPASELERLRAALREREEALRRVRLQLRSVGETLPFGMALHDLELRYLSINRALAELHGKPAEAHLGRTPSEIVPGLAPFIEPLLRRVIDTGQSIVDRELGWAVAPDRIWSCDVLPVTDEDSRGIGVSITVRDVTEQRTREETLRRIVAEQEATRTELEQSQEALLDAHRHKDAFLAMLGHELRNPLAAIRNVSGILGLLGRRDRRLARAQAVIERQSSHMTRIVDGLLDISRLARGKIRIESRVLDLGELVRTLVQDCAHTFARRRIRLDLQLSGDAVWVKGDRVRLVQVFDNLLGNAIKFTPAGGTIVVMLSCEHGCAEVIVRDTGRGIDPELLPTIFEPFWQARPDGGRDSGGLGLGLAVARALVELHGGTIVARSHGAGTGAELRVSLPLSAAPPIAAPQRQRRPATQRILVVEDNKDAAETLRDLLELAGHVVDVVYNAKAALEVVRARPPDVVLCDIGLPGPMNGHDLARTLRRDPVLGGLTLVALTGYGHHDDQEAARAAGFDAHLTKPVDLAAIEAALKLSARTQVR